MFYTALNKKKKSCEVVADGSISRLNLCFWGFNDIHFCHNLPGGNNMMTANANEGIANAKVRPKRIKQTGTYNPPAASLLLFSFTVDHLSLWHKRTTHMAQKNPVSVHGILNILHQLQSSPCFSMKVDLSYSLSMLWSLWVWREMSCYVYPLAKYLLVRQQYNTINVINSCIFKLSPLLGFNWCSTSPPWIPQSMLFKYFLSPSP